MKKQLLLIISLSLTLFGCATHRSETADIRKVWVTGNTAEAEKLSQEIVEDKADSGDELIWLLEHGAISRANRDFEKSTETFDKAYEKIKQFESEAEISVSNEAKGLLLNQSYTEYKGYNYDKIMLSIYQSLNFLEMKRFERANLELMRLKLFQDESQRKNLERIEKAQQKMAEEKASDENAKNVNVNALLGQGGVGDQFGKYYGDNYKKDPKTMLQQAKNLYVNPFGIWLYGISMLNSDDASDLEQGAAAMRICSEMLGKESEVLNADAATSELVANGTQKKMGNITYVVFETGCAPIREQFRIDLPLYVINKDLPHVSVNFPYLTKQNDYLEDANVVADGKALKFDLISDMDSIIEEEFYIELPMVITKTLVSAAAKATAQYFAAKAAGKYGTFVNIGMSVLQVLTNDADLRTWVTLPKQIRLARVETPADGKILIDNIPFEVNKDGVNIVYIKSMSKMGQKSIRKIDFKPAPKAPAPQAAATTAANN